MADLVQNPDLVVTGTTESPRVSVAGATITAGMPVYVDGGDANKVKPCVATGTVQQAKIVGIALTNAAADQILLWQGGGKDIDPGAGTSLVVGETYVVSNTSGKIKPIADLATGEYVSYVGYATTTSNLRMLAKATGVQHA